MTSGIFSTLWRRISRAASLKSYGPDTRSKSSSPSRLERCEWRDPIEWSQVDLKAALVRLEEDLTKKSEARTIPLPDALVKMLKGIESKDGTNFDTTNLRKVWQKVCSAAGLGKLEEVEGRCATHGTLG